MFDPEEKEKIFRNVKSLMISSSMIKLQKLFNITLKQLENSLKEIRWGSASSGDMPLFCEIFSIPFS
ncbi:hypothetical protein H5410_037373 [Solanum commersonii]|uniref:Uncharacterized protein n=1 Tax=Solanum commersonii TaxID=4109 RepID=A0A9J5Y7M5_SOLCO|nr:hypothetical protein H5410_037373 [Solanum commersonii]